MNNLLTRSIFSYMDLKKEAIKDLEAGEDGEGLAAQVEMSKTDKSLQPFFEEAEVVKEEMASIRGLLALSLSLISHESINSPWRERRRHQRLLLLCSRLLRRLTAASSPADCDLLKVGDLRR